jgi:hypothetical protein
VFNNLVVNIAKPELLLAMKLKANRGRRDTEDIEFLLEHLGIKNLNDAQDIYEAYYSQEVISDSANQRILEWLRQR